MKRKILAGDFKAEGSMDLALKDLRVTMELAEPPGEPVTEEAMALAARYLESVVEDLDLCPYARPARRAGGVRMERIGSGHGAEHCAARVAQLAQDAAAEAILLVFDLEAGDARHDVRVFEAFLREFQNLYRASNSPAFYSVIFHPRIEERVPRTTPDSLIQVIRRAPVPMIQCLRASVMEAVRGQAQSSARERLAAGASSAGWALTDSVLSQAVAQANFERCGEGDGRLELEERLRAVGVRPNEKSTT